MYTRSDAGTGDGREGATGHGIGTAILEARSGVGSSANNDVAAASRSHRSFSSFSCLFFSLARFTGPGASVREVGGTDSASSGAVVHGVDHAIVKSSRHRYGAQPTSRLAHPLPSRPQCSVNPLGASENGSLLTAGVRGSRRHHIAHKDAPPKQRAFVSMATATTGPRVDLAATQKDVCAHSPSHRGSSASCIDEPHTSLSTAPCATIGAASAGASSAGLTATATSLENGCTNSSQLRAVAKLAKASSGLKCDAGDARSGSGSGNTVPQHERGHAPGRGSSSPSSRALNGSHHPHRYRKPHTEEHKRGKSADSRGRLQKVKVTADVRADQLKFSRHPDQPCITQFSGLAAEPTAPPRCVSTCDVAFEASSRRAPTPDHAKAFRPTARKSVVEGSHSTLTTSSRRHVTAQERCTDDLKPSPSTTPGSPKALAASMPTVRFIYTNRRSRSNDGSEKKPTYRSVSAAKNTLGDDICAVVCASTESTPSAVKVVERTEERAAASTPIASAPLPRSTQLILRRGTQPKRNTKGTHRRPSVRDPFARSLTYSGVYTQEAREAAQLTSEGRGRQEDQKRRIASKDAEHATDSVLRRASTNDFEDVSYSYLQRWRQRQEKNRSNRKDVISMSTSTSSTVEEGATTLTDVLGKNKAFATSNEEEAKSLPSDSATGTPFRGEGKNDISSAKSATSAHTGLAVAPQRVTKVRERQCRGSATAEARNSANAPTVSGPFILSDVSHSDAIPRAPEATLAPSSPSETQRPRLRCTPSHDLQCKVKLWLTVLQKQLSQNMKYEQNRMPTCPLTPH
ncbi:hypothetical protein, conserved [Leishmania tarentolae]|uniref:Uncharacterized protein n=1 Tax=Leishmania tarentolae TaxID=5689 RepID=A0A640KUF5_LEITA|nr:hypothetical protein, conserved [Leishmania tarentolae]